jgi:hypothetical protein
MPPPVPARICGNELAQSRFSPDMVRLQTVVIPLVLSTFCAVSVDGHSSRVVAIRVNVEAFDWAAGLIVQGHFVVDKKGAWSSDRPTRAQENDFVRDHGFQGYSKWYLAVDERHAADSKARYKFPFGDFQNVHRCGLLAIKARAHEYRYHEIEDATAKLLVLIESTGPARQKRVD